MSRSRTTVSLPMLAALFFLSLSAHVGVWQIFEVLVSKRAAMRERVASKTPLRVALVEEEETREERERIPERVVKNSRLEKEIRSDDAALLSEFDNQVERERQASLSRGAAGAAGNASAQRPRRDPSPSQKRERSAPEEKQSPIRRTSNATQDTDIDEALVLRPDDAGMRSGPSMPTAPPVAADTPHELRSDPESLRGLFGQPGSLDRVDGIEEGQENLFNTRRSRYASFFNRIRDAVSQRWHPEVVHKKRDPYGQIYGEQPRRTVLRVLLNPDGSLHRVYTDVASGVDYLDEEAIRAMRAAAPFVNPPSQLVDARTGKIEFTFGFVLLIDGTKKIFRYRR